MKLSNNYLLLCLLLIFLSTTNQKLSAETQDTLQMAFDDGLANANFYETPRGNLLRYTHFKSPSEGPKKTIFFIQGRGTFLEFYETVVMPLLERGFDVWMYDLSGQGASSRLLDFDKHDELTALHMQHIDSFDLYVEDAHAFVEDVLLMQAEGKLYLGGYSTGGHVVIRYLQLIPRAPFEAAFIISPLLSLKTIVPNTMMSYFLWVTSFLIDLEFYMFGATHEDPVYTMSFEGNPYTGDESGFRELQKLCHQNKSKMMGGVSFGWVKAASDSLNNLWLDEALNAIQIPVLIGTGGADGVVDVSYNEYFANRLKRSKHVYYPEGRHELFRETPGIKAAWWNDFDDFFSRSNEKIRSY